MVFFSEEEGYEEFCQKHLCEDEKVAYVRKIAQAINKTESQFINSAVSSDAGFLTAFNKSCRLSLGATWQQAASTRKRKELVCKRWVLGAFESFYESLIMVIMLR